MKIIRDLGNMREEAPCSMALGTFDGLHPGHLAVLDAAREAPWDMGVFTFADSPSGSPAVAPPEDKEQLLEKLGTRRLYIPAFAAVKEMEAEDFARDILFARCGAKQLCCGEDFRFGKAAKGDVALLSRLCEEAGARLRVVSPVLDGGEKISSTRIRAAIEAGDIPLANRLLGRPFGFSLEVIHGNHIGSGLGTPTINQALPQRLAIPPFGVYASWAKVGEAYYYGVTNIGVKPTVGSDRVLSETWMPDFSGDLYGQTVRLLLLRFIRPEKKFPSLEALKQEILKNGAQAKEIAGNSPPKSLYKPDFL